ncbi:MAG: hypothetical protein HYY01_15600 [Chloroflexi bacterium]|nr:hypothetical protein [Chloroflexota bacterium]
MAGPKNLFIDLRTSVGSPQARQALHEAHARWLQPLVDQGKVIMGGRLADGTGAVIIYNVATMHEAVALNQKDPFVANGLTVPNIKAWNVSFYQVSGNR